MKTSDLDEQVCQARREMSAWLQRILPGASASDFILTEAFCTLVRQQFELELAVGWDPEAGVFQACWLSASDPTEGVEDPFRAETLEDVRVLACAGLLRLVKAVCEETADDAAD